MSEKILQELSDQGQELEKYRLADESRTDAWWDSLTEQERQDAFYSVCKRIHKADIKDNGTYRHALYNVFGFDPSMYIRGVECGYMTLHNILFDGEELNHMKNITRFEVIDDSGRAYVNHLDKSEDIKYILQDDNKTLKVFITNNDLVGN